MKSVIPAGMMKAMYRLVATGRARVRLLGAVVGVLTGVCLFGAEDYAPLPTSIVQSKTVYVVNQSNLATIADSPFSELKKWKRFRVVDDKGEAELVFVFTPTSKGTQGTVGAVVNIGGMPVAVARAVESGETQLAILDAKTGEKLWVNTKPWSSSGSIRDLIRDLRKRIEKQERRH